MNARERYDAAIARLRQSGGGHVTEQDFFPGRRDGRASYRLGYLAVRCSVASIGEDARRMAELAVETKGYMTMHTHDAQELSIGIQISRDLDDDDFDKDEPMIVREVRS